MFFSSWKLKCCGIYGPDDWMNELNSANLPKSCCQDSINITCTRLISYKHGCKEALFNFFEEHAWCFIGMAIFITFIEILLFGLSCSLYAVFSIRTN